MPFTKAKRPVNSTFNLVGVGGLILNNYLVYTYKRCVLFYKEMNRK